MIEFTILGQVYSLKNSRKLITLKGDNVRAMGIECQRCHHQNRVIHVPSDKATAFERAFKKQLPSTAVAGITGPVSVSMEIFYPSNLQDLDEALVLDLLQRYGVIANDRQVVSKYVEKRVDPDNPRVTVKLWPVSWERTGKQPGLLDDRPQAPAMGAVV